MISEERVEAAVEYLRDTAERYAASVGHAGWCEDMLRVVKSMQMNEMDGPLGKAEAHAYGTDEYRAALEAKREAVSEMTRLRALREAADRTIDVWRSQNSARKQGNI